MNNTQIRIVAYADQGNIEGAYRLIEESGVDVGGLAYCQYVDQLKEQLTRLMGGNLRTLQHYGHQFAAVA